MFDIGSDTFILTHVY